jgi:hypothetical protein
MKRIKKINLFIKKFFLIKILSLNLFIFIKVNKIKIKAIGGKSFWIKKKKMDYTKILILDSLIMVIISI